MTEVNRELGIDVTNSFGLPKVRIERPAIVKGYQYFKVTTEKQGFEFYVTKKGYIRILAVLAVQPKRGQGG